MVSHLKKLKLFSMTHCMWIFTIPIILMTNIVIFFILLGESAQDRLLFVSYMERNNVIRLISAREATSSERKAYEQY